MKTLIFLAGMLLPLAALSASPQVRLMSAQGSVGLFRELSNMHVPSRAPDNMVCVSPSGEIVEVMRRIVSPDSSIVWLLVRVTTGTCSGQIGWVRADNTIVELAA